jgi:glycosyltransferase involved in cell wall biosynthesis
MRLGVYNDDVYRLVAAGDETRVSADRAFLLFACEVGEGFERLVLLGRTVDDGSTADYLLPAGTEVAPLPHYDDLFQLRRLARVSLQTLLAMWRALDRVDCVWVFGPHPFALPLVALALVRRRTVVLGVRFDAPRYYRARLPTGRWRPALLAVRALDLAYRLLARRLPATVVGPEIARRYGSRPSVLEMTVSLVREADVAASPPDRDWVGPLRLMTIGRIDREKNPFLLVDALAELERAEPGRYRLDWVGRGPLEDAVAERARALGVDGLIAFHGYVPFGPALFHLYRGAHVLVHTSLTEGVPQVLVEALALGTPVVATDVGGVRALLGDGAAGVLVPPEDRDALVAAVRRVAADEELRAAMPARGLRLARAHTLEAQATRVAKFISGAAGSGGRA